MHLTTSQPTLTTTYVQMSIATNAPGRGHTRADAPVQYYKPLEHTINSKTLDNDTLFKERISAHFQSHHNLIIHSLEKDTIVFTCLQILCIYV